MSKRVASTSPCTSRGWGRTRYQIDRPATAMTTRPTMSDGRRLGGAGRLPASLSPLTGSPPRGFAASVRGISPRAARATGVWASGIGRFIARSGRPFALSSRVPIPRLKRRSRSRARCGRCATPVAPCWCSTMLAEHEHIAALGRQQNCRHLATGGGELDQRRLRTEVVVPHVIMHRLEDPARLACIYTERDECGAVLLLLIRAQRRVVVAPRVAHL